VGEIAVGSELYEEAFTIYKKFNLNVKAVDVLLDNIGRCDLVQLACCSAHFLGCHLLVLFRADLPLVLLI
jgi:hypothetical protein